jgi:hypothetical protein
MPMPNRLVEASCPPTRKRLKRPTLDVIDYLTLMLSSILFDQGVAQTAFRSGAL